MQPPQFWHWLHSVRGWRSILSHVFCYFSWLHLIIVAISNQKLLKKSYAHWEPVPSRGHPGDCGHSACCSIPPEPGPHAPAGSRGACAGTPQQTERQLTPADKDRLSIPWMLLPEQEREPAADAGSQAAQHRPLGQGTHSSFKSCRPQQTYALTLCFCNEKVESSECKPQLFLAMNFGGKFPGLR